MNTETIDDNPICVIGDVHGHLQLGLCMAARWQRELDITFDAVLLCGDVGTFTADAQLDNSTRRHGKANPCELEFLYQWSVQPPPAWLFRIFEPVEQDGLGLTCPVVMVHGNHEGFAHLATLTTGSIPNGVVAMSALPAVDAGRHIRYLPSGWRCRTPSGAVVAGVGGIEFGQRSADYHRMAYIDEDAVAHLLDVPPVDVLITHQGPSERQGEKGSDTLQLLLDAGTARTWFHGHSTPKPEIGRFGPNEGTLVVPMETISFPGKGPEADDPGKDGWAVLYGGGTKVRRERPDFWREYRKRKWQAIDEQRLVCPDLMLQVPR